MKLSEEIDRLQSEGALPERIASLLRTLSEAAEVIHAQLQESDIGRYELLGSSNESGDLQSRQDTYAHELLVAELKKNANVRFLVSEEAGEPVRLGEGDLSISIDPFDGSAAYQLGIPAGTIFCFFDGAETIEQFCGRNVVCSGLFLYGHRLELFFAFGGRTFALDPNGATELDGLGHTSQFVCANLSNLSIFPLGWRKFFEENFLDSRSRKRFNSRWFGSLATHTKAVILTGGLFAYPPDRRNEMSDGHLRLLYEAIPISFLIEALGGSATNGTERVLDLTPTSFHQKTPFAFGEVELVNGLEACILSYPE